MEIDPGQESEAFWQGLILSRPHAAIFMVRPCGTIIKLNCPAQHILDSQRTFYLSNGRIRHRDPTVHSHIQTAISSADADKADTVIMDADRTLVRIVRTTPPPGRPARPGPSVLLVEPAAETLPTDDWSTIFNLTPMELRVAKLVSIGKSGSQIAYMLNIELTTVRTHIRALHNKCDVHSNSQLAHVLTKISFF